MITEEIGYLNEIETAEQQKQDAVIQISNLLVRIEDQGINAQEVLNQAKEAYEKSKQQSNNSQMERKLTKAEKDKKEEIAQAMEEDNPDIDMSKKMAIATAQAKKSA